MPCDRAVFVVTDVVIWSVLLGGRVDCDRSVNVFVVAVIVWAVLLAVVSKCQMVGLRSVVVVAVIVPSFGVSVDVGRMVLVVVRAVPVPVADISWGVVLDHRGLNAVVKVVVAVVLVRSGVVGLGSSMVSEHWSSSG